MAEIRWFLPKRKFMEMSLKAVQTFCWLNVDHCTEKINHSATCIIWFSPGVHRFARLNAWAWESFALVSGNYYERQGKIKKLKLINLGNLLQFWKATLSQHLFCSQDRFLKFCFFGNTHFLRIEDYTMSIISIMVDARGKSSLYIMFYSTWRFIINFSFFPWSRCWRILHLTYIW